MTQYLRLLMVSGPPDQVEPAAKAHAEQLERLRESGKLRLAGGFVNGDGFCEILEVEDRHEAERLTRDSPLVERGLVSWILREWKETS
jgi:uncharacterized protein YciI